ncbi:MAG: RNA polymerase sigma factor [candidate division Zixibacteria bacterium]|nr:RNA polymerase sigma factor [candidate division Zixibacteria bacterium]
MTNDIPELVQRFVEGDSAAFTELVTRYRKKIYQVAFQIVRNHLDADEVVQETFVRVYKKKKELLNVNTFTSFLVRIATNYAIDMLRRRKGHIQISDELIGLPSDSQLDLARSVRTPRDDFEDRVIMTEINRALATLPPKQRITVVLHDIEGHTKAEVAVILNCPEATVRSNLHIARSKLKNILKKRLAKEE